MLSFAWSFVSSDCEVFHDFSALVPVSFVKLAACVFAGDLLVVPSMRDVSLMLFHCFWFFSLQAGRC